MTDRTPLRVLLDEQGNPTGLAEFSATDTIPAANLPAVLVTSVAGRAGDVVLAKGDVGLPLADNTADVTKPVSTPQQTALNGKVSTTGNETISGTKTFSTAPLIPLVSSTDASQSAASTQTVRGILNTFGLGSTVPRVIPDADVKAVAPGWYVTDASTLGTLPTTYGILRSDSYAGGLNTNTWAFQTFYSAAGGGIYFRFSINLAAWSVWTQQAPLNQPTFTGGVTSVLSQNAFKAQAPTGQPQTGMSLSIPAADADRKVFEWLSLYDSSPRMVLRTINDAYSAGTEFFAAYRAASGHAMDRLSIKSLNVVVGQDAQINTNYRLQSAGGISTTGPLLLGIFTLTTLPSAATYAGSYITVSNATGGAKLCYSNGTNWLIANTTTIVS